MPPPLRRGLRDRWYRAVKAGRKTVEGRLRGDRLASAPPGAPVEFRNSERADAPPLAATVTSTKAYPTFRAMLEGEGLGRVLPGVAGLDEGVAVYRAFYSEEREGRGGVAAVRFALGAPGGPLARNSTSFPTRLAAKLRRLHAEYRAAAEGAPRAGAGLRYYQHLVRTVMTNPEYGVGADGNGRGLLVYHAMGMGKTLLAVATAAAMWDVRAPFVIVPKSLQKNFLGNVERYVAMANPALAGEALAARQAAAARRFRFISLDAYNMAAQVERAAAGVEGAASLNNRLLIVDEAHNLFRGVINSAHAKTNARRLYEMVMGARNLRILFLTGTPASKDPFELVPCFNMLAGRELLPTTYEVFYRDYVDPEGGVRNRGRLANRLLGLVSHVAPGRPSEPGGGGGGRGARDAGGFPEELPTKIERVEMGAEQYRQYLLAREKEEAEGSGSGPGPGGRRERVSQSPPLSLPGSGGGGAAPTTSSPGPSATSPRPGPKGTGPSPKCPPRPSAGRPPRRPPGSSRTSPRPGGPWSSTPSSSGGGGSP